MEPNWAAVAEAINTRLAELKMTQQELAHRSGVSVATLRELQRNYQPKRRSPRTLAAISEGLRWPPHYLSRVLDGAQSAEPEGEVDALRAAVDELKVQVAVLDDRLSRIEAGRRENA